MLPVLTRFFHAFVDFILSKIMYQTLPSIGELAKSPTIGHDLHEHNTQIWLANIFCLLEYTHRCDKVWRVLWLVVSPGLWVAVNASASHNTQHCPERTIIYCNWLDYIKKKKSLCTSSDRPMINYNQKSVGLDSWTDDQAQS